MVGYAYDLGPRQSSRMIEQSIHQNAMVWAETIEQSQPRALAGNLCSCHSDVICLQLNPPHQDHFSPITGQYYQLIISLEDRRYLTVSDLLDVKQEQDQQILVFTRPENLQVMQRRRFCREEPGQSIPVYISWEENEVNRDNSNKPTPAFGQIKDLGVDGMSVRVSDTLDSCLFIGDTVHIRFSVNVRDKELFTSATICHKELTKERSELIIGLNFIRTNSDNDFQDRLGKILSTEKAAKKGV